MRIERAARTFLGVAVLFFMLFAAGCGSVSNDSSATVEPVAAAQDEGDWAMPMLAGGGVGIGMFPAKFTFDVTAAPSCTNDFVAYNTSLAGEAATAASSRSGTVAGTPTNGQTVTIGGTLVLTASSTLNTGLNFLVGADTTATATNLAAAIARNGASVGVTAGSTTNSVTVTATTSGAQGDLITLAEGLTGFSWAGGKLSGGVGTGNIVAFNHLYSTQGGDCLGNAGNGTGPQVYWSYFTGTGKALTSIVLSGDGSKVAFVENVAGGATLRILKWKAGEGNGAGYPVAPTTTLSIGESWAANCPAGNSCVIGIAFSGAFQDTGSSPFYNYSTDTLYVGDDSSRMHKFTGVFNGTPTEVTTGWPIQVNAATNLTGPVFDNVSGNIFVGDSSGRLSYIREVGSTVGACSVGNPPCVGTPHLQVGTGGNIDDSPIVDGTTGRVLAFNGSETTNHGTVLQASTALAGAASFPIAAVGTGPIYSGAFDNTYITSASPTIAGHMYVCGKDPVAGGARPAIYQLSFDGTGVLTGVGTPLVGLVSADGTNCSPVTEAYNPNASGGGKDWIFFSVADSATNGDPIPSGSSCRTDTKGCLMLIDVTGNPAWPPLDVTNARSMPNHATGSTSGIVVDNVADPATSPQASSIYLSYGGNSNATTTCNGLTGIGCAVKLTQSALQ
jgi:hypothetical protein